jgi:hypothetical protein
VTLVGEIVKRYYIDDWCVLVTVALIFVFLVGCCPLDQRVVHPIAWHEVDDVELRIVCQDWSGRTRGCVVSRVGGDHIYVLPAARP